MMAQRARRHWRFRRSLSRDRTYRDWFGKRQEPETSEGMAHVQELVHQIVKEARLESGVALDDLRKIWREVTGEMIAQHSQPLSIERGVLAIRVTQPVIRYELQQMQELLVGNIQAALPASKVRALKIIL